jgi:hypothetical protein
MWPCSFCDGVSRSRHFAPSRQAYRRHLQWVHHMDLEHIQVGRVGSDRYVRLEGEETAEEVAPSPAQLYEAGGASTIL